MNLEGVINLLDGVLLQVKKLMNLDDVLLARDC